MSHNVNVPFSWEVKPGVSKVAHEEAESLNDMRDILLRPPPSLSKSARFCVDDRLIRVLQPPPPRCSAKKCNVLNKVDDPFVAAYRKCAEYSINGKLGSDNKNDAGKSRSKKNMFTLSCKYSCTVSSDNVLRLSQCSKDKAKEVNSKLTAPGDVKSKQDKLM